MHPPGRMRIILPGINPISGDSNQQHHAASMLSHPHTSCLHRHLQIPQPPPPPHTHRMWHPATCMQLQQHRHLREVHASVTDAVDVCTSPVAAAICAAGIQTGQTEGPHTRCLQASSTHAYTLLAGPTSHTLTAHHSVLLRCLGADQRLTAHDVAVILIASVANTAQRL
jgi:hypothetical protein